MRFIKKKIVGYTALLKQLVEVLPRSPNSSTDNIAEIVNIRWDFRGEVYALIHRKFDTKHKLLMDRNLSAK